MYIHVAIINVKRSHELEKDQGRTYGGYRGRKRKAEVISLYNNLKNLVIFRKHLENIQGVWHWEK